MPFPLMKLVSIGLKQGSKYVATFVKMRAKQSPFARKCITKPAGWYHTVMTRARMKGLGFGKVKEVKPLSEAAALELGTEILGDLVIIGCALAIYVYVESGSSKNDKLEEEQRQKELSSMKKDIAEYGLEVETLSAQIRELERRIAYKS